MLISWCFLSSMNSVTCVDGESGSCSTECVPDALHGSIVEAAIPQTTQCVLLSVCAHVVGPVVWAVADRHLVEVKLASSRVPHQYGSRWVGICEREFTHTCRPWNEGQPKNNGTELHATYNTHWWHSLITFYMQFIILIKRKYSCTIFTIRSPGAHGWLPSKE